MFKIDWPCAIGGALVGYYAKGKVESAKTQFKGIYTGAIDTLKEAFTESPEEQAAAERVKRINQQIDQQAGGEKKKNG